MIDRATLRHGNAWLLVSLMLLSVGGCQSVRDRFFASRTAQRPARAQLHLHEETPKLTAAQTLDVQCAMARALEQQGDLQRAEAAYRALNERAPHQPAVLHRLAIVCDRQQRPDEAESLFRSAIDLDKTNAELMVDYGYFLYRHDRISEAEAILRSATAIQPGNRRAHNHLGLVLCRMDRTEEGLQEFARGGCSRAEAHLNLAVVFTLSDRFEEARHQYRLATALGLPDAERAEQAQRLDAILAEAGVTSTDVDLVSGTKDDFPPARVNTLAGHARVLAD